MADDQRVEDPFVKESDADSAAYTSEREDAAREKLATQQEQARENFTFLGEPEPDVEIPSPEDRPLEWNNMRDAEVEALKTQNEIASDDYEPVGFSGYVSRVFDSPDINPDAKEFQLKDDFSPSDEHTGPEAASEAMRTGVNPRSAATASDREGMEQPSEQMAPVSENAEEVEEE